MTRSISMHRLGSALVVAAALTFGFSTIADTSAKGNGNGKSQQVQSRAKASSPVTGTYQIDPWHTMILAQWNHVGFSNPTANFADVTGVIHYDASRPSRSSVQVTIPISGLHGFSAPFDQHLRAPDLFDIAQFPQATFNSTHVLPVGNSGLYWIKGNLTIKGITKSVLLVATLNGAGVHAMNQTPAIGFDAYGEVNRSDFGLGLGVPLVSDKVSLRITTEANIGGAAPH